MLTRGIVTGSRLNFDQGFYFNGAVDEKELPKWLLYWDKIAYAGLSSNGVELSGNHSNDIMFLQSEGIFQTALIDIDTSQLPPPEEGYIKFMGLTQNQIPIACASARVSLAEKLSSEAPSIWSLGQSGGEHLLLPGQQPVDLIDVQLVNCLPVPRAETPFEDILNFKAKHQDELEQLRSAFESLRENILSSEDGQRALHTATHDISRALTDIDAALSSKKILTLQETISLYTSNPSAGFWMGLGNIAASYSGIPLEVGGATGVGISTVCRFLKRSIDGGDQLPNSHADFAYVYEVVKHLP